MTHVRVVDEAAATGTVAEDYQYLSEAYGRLWNTDPITPRVYTTSSILPTYFRYGALVNRVWTNDGQSLIEGGPLPRPLVNFAVAFYSACFY